MDGDNAIGALAQAIEGVIGGIRISESVNASNYTVTDTSTELTGTRQTITTAEREYWLILGIWDFSVTTAGGANAARGTLYGDPLPPLGLGGQYVQFGLDQVNRGNGIMSAVTPVLEPGTYAVWQRAHKTTTGGVVICNALNTRMTIIRIPAGLLPAMSRPAPEPGAPELTPHAPDSEPAI